MKECRFLTDSGLLEPGKYELLGGEILSKMGHSRIHIIVVTAIISALSTIFGTELIQSQAQVGIGEKDPYNDPEPDAVVKGKLRDYPDREPDPATEIRLALEAAHTSLQGDITTKVALYARHGVPEYWVAAIPRRELLVFRRPGPDGYADVQTLGATDTVTPPAAPKSPVRVADLLP